ncbi:MAG TPA: DUF1501 domain-containing protein [Acidimicrobiales bacterium]|nr:DUF1501 domain-containing protein [Acidimicrobiales bacterium]
MSRRAVLAAGAGAAGLAAAGGVAAAVTGSSTRPPSTAGAHARAAGTGTGILVLITCYGGNDGLNTVVPAADPAYQAARPTLGYHPAEVLPLADGLGLNPRLSGLHTRWAAGQLAVVRGVGYPDPTLSHFASMDVWQTGSPGGLGTGWLGRWLDKAGRDPLQAISLGATLPPELRGSTAAATAITGDTITLPQRPALLAGWSACCAPGPDRPDLAAAVAASGADLLKVRSSLASLLGSATASSTPGTAKPGVAQAAGAAAGGLAAQMAVVARLIAAGAPTRVYQVSMASFDTHADEKATHERLLGELDAGITALLDGVAATPRAGDVVAVTVSEFGRRPAQNASGGTDHGTAAPMLVAGHGVKGGLYGDEPSLGRLDAAGNLVLTTDFRSVYATLLDRVVGADPAAVLGGTFPQLGFVA